MERSWLVFLPPCDLSKISSSAHPLSEHASVPLSPSFLLSESQCPASRRTAPTPSLPRGSTGTAAMTLRATWWRVRARWGYCAGRTCWCTGSTSRTDTCETQTNGNWISVGNMQIRDYRLQSSTKSTSSRSDFFFLCSYGPEQEMFSCIGNSICFNYTPLGLFSFLLGVNCPPWRMKKPICPVFGLNYAGWLFFFLIISVF